VTFYEWLLFLHVVAAFLTVAGVVFFVALLLATRRAPGSAEAMPLLRLSGLGFWLWNIGAVLVLVLGIALAIDVDGYEVWDGWILLAIALWLVASGAGGRIGQTYQQAVSAPEAEIDARLAVAVRTPAALILHAVMAISVLALLVVMIYKPGAGP
jgi:uncharacterized membrane protein